MLREIRSAQDITNLKIETLAGSIISLRKDFGVLDMKVEGLTGMVEGMRADTRTVAIAVDGHAARLDKIEILLDTAKH